MPDVADLNTQIITEAHHTRYSVHFESTKMYHNLKVNFGGRILKGRLHKFYLDTYCVNR